MPTRFRQTCKEWFVVIIIATPMIAIRILADTTGGWISWMYLSFFFLAVVGIAGVVVAGTFWRHIEDSPRTDEERLEFFRRKMRKCPVGHWMTRFGGGKEIVHGEAMEFGADGSGRFFAWGGEEPIERAFQWRSVGDFRIEVCTTTDDEWRTLDFDFDVRRNEYDVVELRLNLLNGDSFLWSSIPLTFSEPISSEFAVGC